MTVSAVLPRVVYAGSGAGPATFNVANDGQPIVFLDNSEIVVAYRDEFGADSILVEDTHYTLTGGPTAGVVTRSAGSLPGGSFLAIYRDISVSQDTDLVHLGEYSSESVESALDYRTRIDQDLSDLAFRALKTDVFDGYYDAGSRRITGLSDATEATDAVTFGQLADAYAGDLDLTASVIGFTPAAGVPAVTDVKAALELLGNRTRGAANTVLANASGAEANMAATAKAGFTSSLTPAANDSLIGFKENGDLVQVPIGNLPSSAGGLSTGAIMGHGALTAPSGWVRINGRTIGSASSGATERANADTQALHEFLWTNYPNLLVGSTAFASTANPTLGANSSGFGGNQYRFVVPASAISTSGRFIRLTLTPPTSGNNTTIANVFIGHPGTAPNFDGFQERVTFSGSNGVTLTAGGASVVSDAIEFALDEARDLIVAIEITGTSDVRYNASATGYSQYVKAGTADYHQTTVTGYTLTANALGVLDLIEVLTGSRGASAAADWAANKAIELPDARFRSIFGFDGMGNSASGRASGITTTGDAPGTYGGKGRRFIDLAELPNYTQGITLIDPGHAHSQRDADGSGSISQGGSHGQRTANTGSAFTGISATLATSINGSNTQAMNPNMPGYLLASIIMKL